MAKPLPMYAMKPVFELDTAIDVPKCMYSLPVIQSSNKIAGVGSSSSSSSPALKALEARQDAILSRLEKLKLEVAAYGKSLGVSTSDAAPSQTQNPVFGKTPDLVVRCSPSHPVFSIPAVFKLLCGAGLSVHTSCHTHSSVTSLPKQCQAFLPESKVSRSAAQVRITLIWKDVGKDCELMVSPLKQTVIKGEVNVLRYFARLFPTILPYENIENLDNVNSMLDTVSSLLWSLPKERQPLMRTLVNSLGKSPFLAGQNISVVDLALYSLVKQLSLEKDLQPELSKWFDRTSKEFGLKTGGNNRNRNSSMRKSGGSPKKGDRRSQEKEKSPKKDVKKGKGDKEDKKAQQKTGKDSVNPSNNHLGKDQLFEFFQQNTIKYTNVDHPEVFTVDAMMPYLKNIEGAICKNLFLKDKKKNLFLLSAVHDKEIKLNDVAKAIGAKELRFADESILLEKLGVVQGCVTAYALLNDKGKEVSFVVDKRLVDGSFKSVNFHPLVNTATTNISCEDFKRFVTLTGHKFIEI